MSSSERVSQDDPETEIQFTSSSWLEGVPHSLGGVVGALGNFAIGTTFEAVRDVNDSVRALGARALIALNIVIDGYLRTDHPELYPEDESSDT